jgi:hypothetical protein
VVPNPVTRLRQPTKLGSWTIVAQGFERRSSYCTKGPSGCHWLPAPTGHRWLITDISVTNTSGEPHTFDSRAVAAHYGGEALSAEVHAQWNTEESLSPNRTIPLELVFPVPVWSHIYTLVFRKDLEAEKHAGTAAEIDLNCC